MAEAKIVATPMDVNVQLKKDDGHSKEVDTVKYQ